MCYEQAVCTVFFNFLALINIGMHVRFQEEVTSMEYMLTFLPKIFLRPCQGKEGAFTRTVLTNRIYNMSLYALYGKKNLGPKFSKFFSKKNIILWSSYNVQNHICCIFR